MSDDKPWTAGRVAERLGIDRSTVHRIPREQLPYRRAHPTPQHPQPRRYYDPADVERYASGMEAERPGPDVGERLTAVEADVRSIWEWINARDEDAEPDVD